MALGNLIMKFLSAEQLRAIALWALRLLEENLDTDLKARVEKYRADQEELETQAQILKAGIALKQDRLTQLTLQRSALEQTIASNEAKLRASQEEIRRIDEEPSKVDNLSDSDVLHSDFRRGVIGATGPRK